MGHSAGSGDRLARGAHSATYLSTEKPITQKTWDDIFADFDPEKFRNKETPKAKGKKAEKNLG